MKSDKEIYAHIMELVKDAFSADNDASVLSRLQSLPQTDSSPVKNKDLSDPINEIEGIAFSDIDNEKKVQQIRHIINLNPSLAEAIASAKPEPQDIGKTVQFRQPRPLEFIVKNFIPANTVTLLVGDGGIGKSKLALMLAMSIAADHSILENGVSMPWLDYGGDKNKHRKYHDHPHTIYPEKTKTPVMYVSYEDDVDRILERVYQSPVFSAYGEASMWAGYANTLFDGRLVIPDNGDDIVYKEPMWEKREQFAPGELTDTGKMILKRAKDVGAKLLVLDSLTAIFADNENDKTSVRRFLITLNGFAIKNKCAVLIISHPSKASAKNKDAAYYSGSVDWRNGVRSMLYFIKHEEEKDLVNDTTIKSEHITLTVDKHSHFKPDEEITINSDSWYWWKTMDKNHIRPGEKMIDDATNPEYDTESIPF